MLIDSFFFFNDTATTEIYTLSLHDALPILAISVSDDGRGIDRKSILERAKRDGVDRKSTRLNSSHGYISYAVFCLKKKTKIMNLSIYTLKRAEITMNYLIRFICTSLYVSHV